MSRDNQLRAMTFTLLVAVAAIVAMRYSAAIDTGVDHSIALRTYAYWAAVCVPVAVLGDILLRSISEYRLVKIAVARVKNRR